VATGRWVQNEVERENMRKAYSIARADGCKVSKRDQDPSEGRGNGIDMVVYSRVKGLERARACMKEKKEERSKGIIRSRTGRRSCKLRDRTQNDVGVLQGLGTTRRRLDKCTCGRARTAAVALVAGEKAGTTMMRRKLNEFSPVLNPMMFAKSR